MHTSHLAHLPLLLVLHILVVMLPSWAALVVHTLVVASLVVVHTSVVLVVVTWVVVHT